MSSSNLALPILGLVAAAALVYGISSESQAEKETFINVPQQRVQGVTGQMQPEKNINYAQMRLNALQNSMQNQGARLSQLNQLKNRFVTVANWQQPIQNRFSSTGYSAYINQRPAPEGMQGVTPLAPLEYGNIVKQECPSTMSSVNNAKPQPEFLSASDLMPAQTMEGFESPECIQIDRNMWSNTKTRTQNTADFIRGDLPIVPLANGGWFNSQYANATNLRTGAMAALGGANNETAKLTAQLTTAYRGTAPSSFAGAPITGAVSQELGIGPRNESVSVNVSY